MWRIKIIVGIICALGLPIWMSMDEIRRGQGYLHSQGSFMSGVVGELALLAILFIADKDYGFYIWVCLNIIVLSIRSYGYFSDRKADTWPKHASR